MKIGFFFFGVFFTFAGVSVNAQNCKYDPDGYRTVPCANELVEYKLGKYKRLEGKVVAGYDDEPVPTAIVSLHRVGKNKLTFVGSTMVDVSGRFCFKNLPNGKYILKVGAEGFKCVDMHLEIAPNDRKSSAKKLNVELNVGT